MKLRFVQSLSGRLTALILFVSGIALLLACVSFLAYDFYSLRSNLIESLETQASMISTNTESALLFDDPQAAKSTLAALRGAPSIVSAEILQPDGGVFASYTRPGSETQSIAKRLSNTQTEQFWIANGTVVLGYPITSGGKLIGSVYILAETRDVTHRAKQFGVISAGILLICFGIALLATSAMRGLLIRPLENLAQTAQVVSRKKDYSVRAEVPQDPDDLVMLVQSFNEMLDEIQKGREVLEQKVSERTAELSDANRELEAFSYTVAHDLRGPLQYISDIVFLLQSDGDGVTLEQKPWLDKLISATKRMASLIEDLLNFSRSASTPIQYVPIDLSALARSIIETLALGSERSVEVVVGEDCTAVADRSLTTVVLENLLRNAWKYSSRKEPSRIEFGCRKEREETVFFVRDNGVGFDPAYADRLFRPFERLHAETDFPGTGIGLATVQRIVGRQGGRVWATGSVGEGAEFCFTLPKQEKQA
jgi:signal transduction histidine kinase